MKFRDARVRRLFEGWDALTRCDDEAEHGLPPAQILTFLTVMLYANLQAAPPQFQAELRGLVIEALRTDPRFLAKKFEVDIDWGTQD